uniref:Uncharacterized protein n=1 Tax=Populus trichocarpa TaxID=3694 RepID=A0A3N7GWY0_POPTR
MSLTKGTSPRAYLETTSLFGIIHILHFLKRSCVTRWTVYPRLLSQCNLQVKWKNNCRLLSFSICAKMLSHGDLDQIYLYLLPFFIIFYHIR